MNICDKGDIKHANDKPFFTKIGDTIQFQTIWLDKLRKPHLMTYLPYANLFSILQNYCNQFQQQKIRDFFTHRVMLELASMLETSIIFSLQVKKKFLEQVYQWLKSQKCHQSIKVFQEKKPIQLNETKIQQVTEKKNIMRPMSSVNRKDFNKSYLLRPMTAMAYNQNKTKQRPESSKYTITSTKMHTIDDRTLIESKTNYQNEVEKGSELKSHTILNNPQKIQNKGSDINIEDNQIIQCNMLEDNDPLFQESQQEDMIQNLQGDQNQQILETQKNDKKIYTKSTYQTNIQNIRTKLTDPNINLKEESQKCFYKLNKRMINEKNKQIMDSAENVQIQAYLKEYQRHKSRKSKQSSRRIQSAKLRVPSPNYKGMHSPNSLTKNSLQNLGFCKSQEQIDYFQPKHININFQSSKTLNQSTSLNNFMINRYYTSTNKLKSNNIKKCTVPTLTSSVSANNLNKNKFQCFEPNLNRQAIINSYNQDNLEQILKIKKCLKKTSHIPTKVLMNALIINEQGENKQKKQITIMSPSNYLMISNPFLKKKKKKLKKKKPTK